LDVRGSATHELDEAFLGSPNGIGPSLRVLQTTPTAPEFFWDDLLEYIEDRRVIPIVGAELLTVVDGTGGETPLIPMVAAHLAARLRVPADDCTGDDALHTLVCRYLQRGGRREEIYPGKLVVVSSQAGFVKLYDAETPCAPNMKPRSVTFSASVEFSADMQRLVTASTGCESITLWDTNSYHRLITLPSPLPALYPVIFSPDGNTLIGQNSAGGATVGHLHFWRAPSWEQIEAAERQAGGERSTANAQH
jgi:hypothetical protein